MTAHSTDCPFCTLPASRVLHTSPHGRAFRDAYPVSDGHTLVVPHRHVASLYDLRPEERAGLWALVDTGTPTGRGSEPVIHAVPSAEEQLDFIRKLRRLLDEGSFVATYSTRSSTPLPTCASRRATTPARPSRSPPATSPIVSSGCTGGRPRRSRRTMTTWTGR